MGAAAHVLNGLQNGCKQIPFSCLYDEKGSALYEEITRLEEYYPFLAEEAMLKCYSAQIAEHVQAGSVVVELGCGTGRKTALLLREIRARHATVKFVGIDVSGPFLEEATRNVLELVPGLGRDQVDMVQAEYLEGLKEVREMYPTQLLTVLWLGSSVGNLGNEEAISFFKDVRSSIGNHHQLFLCADMWKDVATLYAAYCDSKGVTEKFIKNGMKNALSMVGVSVSEEEEEGWVYEVEVNQIVRRVEMYVRFPSGLKMPSYVINSIRPGERILVEVSRKFTMDDLQQLTSAAGYTSSGFWGSSKVYGSQMLVPVKEAFRQCWAETDEIFHSLKDWSDKPIDLRHPFCFYYGHVHSFAKLKVLPVETPSGMDVMFSRGIDPKVDDPSECHAHPEIPPHWPEMQEIIKYGKQVRKLISEALDQGKISSRMVNFVLEHERMHQETLRYMTAQERKKEFEKRHSSCVLVKNGHVGGARRTKKGTTLFIPPGKVQMGTDASSGAFFWDNENPQHESEVEQAFGVSAQPVSVAEFREFVLQKGYEQQDLWAGQDFHQFYAKGVRAPATWSCIDGDFWVHVPAATKHWTDVADEPVFVSLAEAEAFCRWAGGRIMTEAEYHRILDVADSQTMICNRRKPGLSSRNGSADPSVERIRDGGWEWTCTNFRGFPGFQPMPEYPEYSADFFDHQHFVLKGSSPVTHPSLMRDSFRNFYQRLYPYVFAKFRCCFDFSSA